MFNTVRKSKTLYAIALNRFADYKELLRIELKLQGRGVGVQVASYALLVIFAVLAVVFVGVAIIVSAWETTYRSLAAWLVVVLYAVLAAACLLFVKHFHAESTLSTLRNEFQRDMAALREGL